MAINSAVQSAIASGLISFKEVPKPIHRFKPKDKLTPEQLKEVLDLRRAGEPLGAIGRRFGIHHYTIGDICDEHGVKPPSRVRTKEEVEATRATKQRYETKGSNRAGKREGGV